MLLNKKEINELDRLYRLNLINSITGIKPANLIGTLSASGQPNLAIFSSVVHMGSNPPLIGCLSRPADHVDRHTIHNIQTTQQYTINHLPMHMIKNGHYTSAKFPREASEFEKCKFTEEYLGGFKMPFVKESNIKMGLTLVEMINIKSNGTVLIIGEIQILEVDDSALTSEGYINLQNAESVGISGLNSYYSLKHIANYEYAREDELPKWE